MTDPLLHVKNPLQYLNREVNSVHKNFESSEVRIALAFPDMYELGMSHLGLKILYEVINGQDRFLAERVFAPAIDREEQLRRTEQPLSTLESGKPLSHFDIVGFTLPYELTYTNILNMIDLARIPIMAEERTGEHPLICGGGPGAHNPEPLADFFDFFLLGDGEEAILDIAETIGEARGSGAKRDEILRRLAGIAGVYVPSYYQPRHDGDGRLLSVTATLPDLPAWVPRRFLANLDDAPFPLHPPVPYLETTHDRVTIEIARGCIQRCRFCQAGPTYRPYRERSPELVLEMAEKALRNTGYDEISLSALSCGDHSNLHALLSEFMNRYVDKKISVSLPSLRPGTLSEGILREIKKVKRTGFTIAPEAGSQRLRNVVSKGVTEEDIFRDQLTPFP